MSVRVRLQLDPGLPMNATREEPSAPLDLNETLPWVPLRRVQPAPEEPQVRCIRCEGRMERGTAPVRIERPGFHLAWDGLPAWVCSRCEAPYFEEREVRLVQRALAMMRRPSGRTGA
jgi:uncharacterized protein with PIN domain